MASVAADVPNVDAARSSKWRILVPIAVGAAVAALLGVVLWVWTGSKAPDTAAATTASAASSSASAVSSAGPDPAAQPPAQNDAAVSDAAPVDAKPEEKPEEKPDDALVSFSCTPACDEVVCDNKKVSGHESGVRLQSGSHSCQGKAAGYVTMTDKFTVKAGEDMKREMKLSKPASQPARAAPAKTCTDIFSCHENK